MSSATGRTAQQIGLLLGSIALLLAFAGPARADFPPPTIRVAAFYYPPAIFQDADGTVRGWYVDLLDEVASKRNLRFEYIYGTWAEGLERARRGEIDLLTSVAWTAERDAILDYGREPILTVWGELFVHESSAIDGIRQLEGKRVAVMKNDFNGRSFREMAAKFEIGCSYVEMASFEEVFRAIDAGEVDAGVVSRLVAAARPRDFRGKPTGIIFNPFDIFFAVPRGSDAAILPLLDQSLVEWRADAESVYYRSRSAWFGAAAVQGHGLPPWLRYAAGGLGAGAVAVAAWVVTLRRQVRHATKQLRESEARLRLALEAAGQGLYDLNLATGEAIVNTDYARMLGFDPAEFRETNAAWRERLHPEDREAVYQVYLDYMAGRRDNYRVEFRQRTKEGNWKWVLSLGKIVERDNLGNPLRMLGTHTDISAIKEAEQELQAQNVEMERLMYTVSHDLKSPVVTIKGFLELLEMDLQAGQSEAIQRDLDYLNSAAGRMTRLIEEVLEMSRIGRISSQCELIPFADLTGEAISIVGGAITRRGVEVTVTPSPLVLNGDRNRLVEIWQNLIENAVKYMGEQPAPRIEVGLREEPGEFVFFVRDNGSGIEPQYHDKIFGLFDKLDPGSDGSGLGLALVKRIVEMYRGHIWVESAGAGMGSCFCFTLPEATAQKGGNTS